MDLLIVKRQNYYRELSIHVVGVFIYNFHIISIHHDFSTRAHKYRKLNIYNVIYHMHIFQQLLRYSYEMQDKYRQLIVRFSACLSLSVYASD